MPRIRSGFAVAALLTAVAAVPVVAAVADTVTARVAGYRSLGSAFKNLNDELRSGTPQPYVLQVSARQIRDVSKAQYGWFPAGSGPKPGVKTAAKPEIWSQPAQFKAAQDAFATQANAMMKATQSGDVAAMRAQSRQLGATCSACHRTFRVETR